MNLQIIRSSIESYKNSLDPSAEIWDLCKALHRTNETWWSGDDPFALYADCFESYVGLWWRDHRNAVSSMIRYIDQSADLVRSMFDDLLTDHKHISGRAGRFVHHCDTLYKYERKTTVQTLSHGHADKRLIFIYLSTLLPQSYMPYDYKVLSKYLTKVGSKSPFMESDIDRFVKVSRTLCSFMQKDEDLVAMVDEQCEIHSTQTDHYWMMMTYHMTKDAVTP